MRAKDHRKGIPVGVRLKAALRLAGFTDEQIEAEIQWDHSPALGLRSLDENGEITPAANDYRYIVPMTKPAHDIKTRGRGATTAGSDVGDIAKTKRLEKARAFREQMLARGPEEEPPAPAKRKHKWASRPFPKRSKT